MHVLNYNNPQFTCLRFSHRFCVCVRFSTGLDVISRYYYVYSSLSPFCCEWRLRKDFKENFVAAFQFGIGNTSFQLQQIGKFIIYAPLETSMSFRSRNSKIYIFRIAKWQIIIRLHWKKKIYIYQFQHYIVIQVLEIINIEYLSIYLKIL